MTLAPADPLEIVVADDHAPMRGAIRLVLGQVPGWQVVAECGDAESAADAVRRRQPDVLLLDIRMPGRSGLDVLPEIRRSAPGTRVVMLTMEAEPFVARRALAEGAAAYVLKDTAATDLVPAIRGAVGGGSRLDRAGAV
jgi:DNA-binding NarL/FixJ family response regulator